MEREISGEVLERIGKIRLGRDGYVFVLAYDGTMLSHLDPNLVGDDMIDVTNEEGVHVTEGTVAGRDKTGGAYVSYSWLKPTAGRPSPS